MNVLRPLISSPRELSPSYDPWDPITSLRKHGRHVLTSVEFTVTNLCNMRCEHCAVGDSLTSREGDMLPLKNMLDRLEEVEHLETISITGGEPMFRAGTVDNIIVPLLKYAKERGIRSQINSNLTMPYSRYEKLLAYLDVMHISFNYVNGDDFHEVGFANSGHPVAKEAAYRLYNTMIENSRQLSEDGMLISAETMINYRTHTKLPEIHKLILDMGAKRHEVHPMYNSSFASALPVLSLNEMRTAIHKLLDTRDPEVWMLFGTLPFFACSFLEEDQKLLSRMRAEKNVTLRNDPDGRNRVNVNMFTGDVFVTDFADIAAFGNIDNQKLDAVEGLASMGEADVIVSNNSRGYKLDIIVDSTHLSNLGISAGEKIEVEVDMNHGQEARILSGTIEEVANSESRTDSPSSNESGKIQTIPQKNLRIKVVDPELKGGEQARVKIEKHSLQEGLLLSNEAIHEDREGLFVYKVDEQRGALGNVFVAQKIRIHSSEKNEKETMIQSDILYEEDSIILESSEPLEDGNRVRLQ